MATEWRCGICRSSFQNQQAVISHVRSAHGSSKTPVVKVDATTWMSDKHSLFDREATKRHRLETFILPALDTPSYFYRDGEVVRVAQTHYAIPHRAKKLHAQLRLDRSMAAVEQTPKSAKESSENVKGDRMWKCVNDKEGQYLEGGDCLKIGRHKMMALQVCLSGEPQIPNLDAAADNDDPVPVTHCFAVPRKRSTSYSSDGGVPPSSPQYVPRCRICLGELGEDGPDESPMIQAPCLCKGSNGTVHMHCLGRWLATRHQIDVNEDRHLIVYKPPCCEVCKTEFPVMVTLGDGPDAKAVPLLPDLPQLPPPFIVLGIPRSTGGRTRVAFSPTASDAVLRICRGSDCQARLKDVSVSRVHATISFNGEAFVVKDNGSKFQTLIRPREQQVLAGEKALRVQMGRTVFQMALLDTAGGAEGLFSGSEAAIADAATVVEESIKEAERGEAT